MILRPTAFMEQHVHDFNGKFVLEKGRARLIGSGTKPRNFVAADDVAQFAVKALLFEPAPGSPIEIGGPGNASNLDVAHLYSRLTGVDLRLSRMPQAAARAIGAVLKPFHPGLSRLLSVMALPDDAFPETFDSTSLQATHPEIQLTTLESFARARVASARAGASERSGP